MVKNILVYNSDPFGKLTNLTCLSIFDCFIGAFFGTPPTTIDHRAHLCSERGTDGKAVAGRPDEILQQARETGKCL